MLIDVDLDQCAKKNICLIDKKYRDKFEEK